MSTRSLTPAELVAWQELAQAAKRLRRAQLKANQDRQVEKLKGDTPKYFPGSAPAQTKKLVQVKLEHGGTGQGPELLGEDAFAADPVLSKQYLSYAGYVADMKWQQRQLLDAEKKKTKELGRALTAERAKVHRLEDAVRSASARQGLTLDA